MRELVQIQELGWRNRTGMGERAGIDTGVRTEKQNRDGGESQQGYRSQDGEIEQGWMRELVGVQELVRRNRTGMEERASRGTGVSKEKQNRDGGESWYGYRSLDGEIFEILIIPMINNYKNYFGITCNIKFSEFSLQRKFLPYKLSV